MVRNCSRSPARVAGALETLIKDQEAGMTAAVRERLAFRKAMAAGVVGVPFLASLDSCRSFAASAPKYDPSAKFELNVTEVEYRRTAGGRSLKARVYQPKGNGPFPAMLDL